jgi:hypothetical protein
VESGRRLVLLQGMPGGKKELIIVRRGKGKGA